MKFISIRDLRNGSGKIFEKLKEGKEMVVTSRGKPVALLTGVKEENLEEYLLILKRVKAFLAMEKMQKKSFQYGMDKWDEEKVEKEIQAVREKRRNESSN